MTASGSIEIQGCSHPGGFVLRVVVGSTCSAIAVCCGAWNFMELHFQKWSSYWWRKNAQVASPRWDVDSGTAFIWAVRPIFLLFLCCSIELDILLLVFRLFFIIRLLLQPAVQIGPIRAGGAEFPSLSARAGRPAQGEEIGGTEGSGLDRRTGIDAAMPAPLSVYAPPPE